MNDAQLVAVHVPLAAPVQRLDAAQLAPAARVLAVFDASHAWPAENSSKGCSMANAHAEISDPSHPAYAIIIGQNRE